MADFVLRNQWGDPYCEGIYPTQLRFHRSKARRKAYVGFIGSGKTCAGAMEALTKATAQPGHRPGRTIIARETYPQLMKTTWDTFSKIVKHTCPDMIAKERASTYDVSMVLKNGWEFLGSNLRHFQDHGSLEADNFWIDECNDDGIDLSSYNMLSGRLRARMGDMSGWMTGNPGGKNWSWQLFYRHETEGGKPIKGHEGFRPDPKTETNHLPENYLDDLRLTYTEEWIAKFLEGSFDIFEGMILDNLDLDIHLIDDFDIPPEWPRYRGMDHGWTNPTACLWIAVDPLGNHYLYREYYKRCAVPQTNAAAILAVSGPEEAMTSWTVIDPATRQTQTAGGSAQRIIDQYRESGMAGLRLGDNDVRSSIARLKAMLQPSAENIFPRFHKYVGQGGAPRTFIFRSLRHLISEAQQWQWKAVKPGGVDKEVPLAKHDHLIACWRYLEMEIPRAPTVPTARNWDWLSDAINEMGRGRELESPRNLIGA